MCEVVKTRRREMSSLLLIVTPLLPRGGLLIIYDHPGIPPQNNDAKIKCLNLDYQYCIMFLWNQTVNIWICKLKLIIDKGTRVYIPKIKPKDTV